MNKLYRHFFHTIDDCYREHDIGGLFRHVITHSALPLYTPTVISALSRAMRTHHAVSERAIRMLGLYTIEAFGVYIAGEELGFNQTMYGLLGTNGVSLMVEGWNRRKKIGEKLVVNGHNLNNTITRFLVKVGVKNVSAKNVELPLEKIVEE
ncbi:MAG: hypothetical protein Q7R96_02095 [Nanoarchaeota archaeon]|nr:hypothetical protein [Nanoarchaeota archaeon]